MSLYSGSPWKWTLRFLLLSGAALVVGVVSALLHPLFGDASAAGGVFFIIAVLSSYVFLAGVIGAVVCYVRERRGHRAPPAKPVA
jgi:hypothetical protein